MVAQRGGQVSPILGGLRSRTFRSRAPAALLYYRAAEGACATLETDTVPFGCIEDLEVALRPPVRMEPGDIFVALSDGVVDAERMGGERFGTARVIELAEDDRTGLVVKRR